MLNYFRESQVTRFATLARRMYGYVSAGMVVAVIIETKRGKLWNNVRHITLKVPAVHRRAKDLPGANA